ncbi:MAG: hypothetical protein ACJ735_09895 [Actinomycetes bacterium]
MRLTTSSAATLTLAGLAALVTGCSTSSPSSSSVVVHHAPVAAAAAKPAARPLNPKAQLAKAVRASLAAHHVQFRYRVTETLVDRTHGENTNPSAMAAGVADFDHNLLTVHMFAADHANQPLHSDATAVVDGDSDYVGVTDDLLRAATPWLKDKATPGEAADVQVSQVLQDVTGPVRIVRHTANVTEYELQSDMSQLMLDQGGSSGDPIVRELAGTKQTENVWVNRDGLIVRALWTVDPGKTHISGLSASDVKALYFTIDFANYGVDMVVPPHPTVLAAG